MLIQMRRYIYSDDYYYEKSCINLLQNQNILLTNSKRNEPHNYHADSRHTPWNIAFARCCTAATAQWRALQRCHQQFRSFLLETEIIQDRQIGRQATKWRAFLANNSHHAGWMADAGWVLVVGWVSSKARLQAQLITGTAHRAQEHQFVKSATERHSNVWPS